MREWKDGRKRRDRKRREQNEIGNGENREMVAE